METSHLFHICHSISNLGREDTNLGSAGSSPGFCKKRTKLAKFLSSKQNMNEIQRGAVFYLYLPALMQQYETEER